jgi:hypothetical protein
LVPAPEIIAKVDAITLDDVKAVGARILSSAITVTGIGPIRKLPSRETIAARIGSIGLA